MFSTKNILTQRVYAFAIDFLIIIALQVTLGNFTLYLYSVFCSNNSIQPDMDMGALISQFCGAFFFIGYFTASVGFYGNTYGKYLLKLKVLNGKTGKPLTLVQAYWRTMGYLMSSWTYMIGFILPWIREDRRALHDLLCDTLVVQEDENATLIAPQLELPLNSNVLQIQIQTKQEDPDLDQTGTDH